MSSTKKGSAGALLVVDIQEDYTGSAARPPFPYKDSEKLVAAVNRIIDEASKKKLMVVYIRHEFDGFFWRTFSRTFYWGTVIKGTPGTQIDKRVNIISRNTFTKTAPSAFSNRNLDAFLNKHHVHKLYLVGLDAQFCIHATAKGALRRGYDVAVIKDAIALKAEKKWDRLMKKFEQEGIGLITNREFRETAV